MLQSIHDKVHGWIAGVIISLLILSFAMWGIHSYVGGENTSTIAKVNGTEITKGQLSVAYERLRRQLQMQSGSASQLPSQAENGLKDRALQALINLQVLKDGSLKQSYRISTLQTLGFLESMPEFQVNGQFSTSRFQQLLQATLFNEADFLDLIKNSLLIDQPRLGLIFTSFALPNEVANTVGLVNQERNIQYLVLPKSLIPQNQIVISNDKINAYYQQHQNDFKTPELVSIEYITLSLKDLMTDIHPSEDVLKNYYNDNHGSYTSPKQWNLQSLLIPVTDNATESDIAKANTASSELSQKLSKGGDITSLMNQYGAKADPKLQGWVPFDKIPPELQKSVLGLTKAGEVSSPIQTPAGFMVVKVATFKDSIAQPFEEIKNKVQQAYARQQAEEKFADLREKLSNITYEHPESLEPAAKALGLTIKSSELFTRDKGANDITANQKLREAAFSNEVLNQKNNSDVIQTPSDDAVVIRVKDHQPAALLPLKTVQKQIVDKLSAIEVDHKIAQLADDMVKKLNSGSNPDQAAQQYKQAWNQAGFIGRHSNSVKSAILDTAFSMPRPHAGQAMSYAATNVPEGYAVIGLKAVKNGVLSADHEQYQVFATQIQNTQGLIEYELYKENLMKEAKIEVGS